MRALRPAIGVVNRVRAEPRRRKNFKGRQRSAAVRMQRNAMGWSAFAPRGLNCIAFQLRLHGRRSPRPGRRPPLRPLGGATHAAGATMGPPKRECEKAAETWNCAVRPRTRPRSGPCHCGGPLSNAAESVAAARHILQPRHRDPKDGRDPRRAPRDVIREASLGQLRPLGSLPITTERRLGGPPDRPRRGGQRGSARRTTPHRSRSPRAGAPPSMPRRARGTASRPSRCRRTRSRARPPSSRSRRARRSSLSVAGREDQRGRAERRAGVRCFVGQVVLPRRSESGRSNRLATVRRKVPRTYASATGPADSLHLNAAHLRRRAKLVRPGAGTKRDRL